jgi:hypothetical protein
VSGRVVRPSVESVKYAYVSYLEIRHLEVVSPCMQQRAEIAWHAKAVSSGVNSGSAAV